MPIRPHVQKPIPGGRAIILFALAVAAMLYCAEPFATADLPSASAAQVKAIFLLNFAKYVDWPAAAFPNNNAPLTIGVMGTDPFGDFLRQHVEGKTINGHPFALKYLAADADLNGCQILFISDSEASRMGEILDRAGTLPILTVGEDEQFAQKNGIINFVLKDGKVRLEIDLTAARKTGLTISSRLLAVADAVKARHADTP